jgi:hypothetical protein
MDVRHMNFTNVIAAEVIGRREVGIYLLNCGLDEL